MSDMHQDKEITGYLLQSTLAVLLLAVSAPARAEESPTNFFPKNYVQGGEAKRDQFFDWKSSEDQKGDRIRPQRDSLIAPKGAEKPRVEPPQVGGEKVQTIGVALHGSDKRHAMKHLKQLLELSYSSGISIGTIAIIGDGSVLQDNIYLAALLQRGAVISVDETPPEQYKIQYSPTWLLETDKGLILLEAVASPEGYLNARGEFIDRQAAASELGGLLEDKGAEF